MVEGIKMMITYRTGEMTVGPVISLFTDEISTVLDSSTTFQIMNSIRQSIYTL